tara:strand:+ start:9787 stop:10143 length:357 start_codon:yes stop_codon:yes gene_type:complete
MADITTVNGITETGLTGLTYTSASAEGDKFENNGRMFVACKNASEGAVTFTFATQVTSFVSPTYGNATKSNSTLAVPAGGVGFIGPFDVQAYNDSDGYLNITYSAATSVSVAICSFVY